MSKAKTMYLWVYEITIYNECTQENENRNGLIFATDFASIGKQLDNYYGNEIEKINRIECVDEASLLDFHIFNDATFCDCGYKVVDKEGNIVK